MVVSISMARKKKLRKSARLAAWRRSGRRMAAVVKERVAENVLWGRAHLKAEAALRKGKPIAERQGKILEREVFGTPTQAVDPLADLGLW